MRFIVQLAVVTIVFWCAAPLPAAVALPLGPEPCALLDKEKQSLEAGGVLADMQLKPDEVKTQGADRLKRIQRYVEISGDLLFRCVSVAGADRHAPPENGTTAATGGAADKVTRTESAKLNATKAQVPSVKAPPAAKVKARKKRR